MRIVLAAVIGSVGVGVFVLTGSGVALYAALCGGYWLASAQSRMA